MKESEYSLVYGIGGIDNGHGMLENLHDGEIHQLPGRHKLVQLGCQHSEAMQVLAIGDQQSPTIVALIA